MPRNAQFVIGARRADVSEFADRFDTFCQDGGVPQRIVQAFQVAFDELLTNTIDYALAGIAEPHIEVRLVHADSELGAEVVDNGNAFDPLAEADMPDVDLSIDDREVGGLGVHLVRNLMDDVRYERRDGCNHFFMSKRL